MACKRSGVQIPSAPPHTTAGHPACSLRPHPVVSSAVPALGHTWGMAASATASRSPMTATTRACISAVMCR
jgi:hypothetical protein